MNMVGQIGGLFVQIEGEAQLNPKLTHLTETEKKSLSFVIQLGQKYK